MRRPRSTIRCRAASASAWAPTRGSTPCPIEVDGRQAGTLLVGRAAAGAGAADVAIAARPAAAQAALLVLLSRARARRRGGAGLQDLGEAITAGGSEAGIGRLVARLVCEGLGAQRAVVYTGSSPDDLEAVAGHGFRREELSSGPRARPGA